MNRISLEKSVRRICTKCGCNRDLLHGMCPECYEKWVIQQKGDNVD